MKITSNPETAGASCASDGAEERPRKRFSEVLEKKKQRDENSLPQAVPACAMPLPFSSLCDVAPVDAGPSIAGHELEPLLASLVQEIMVVAPARGPASVEIQFDSRTLNGLHVRIEKAGESLEIRLSTSSDAVSRLLATNVPMLAEALVQRGYVAPRILVQPAQGSTPSSTGESTRQGRAGDNRDRHDQGRNQKRR